MPKSPTQGQSSSRATAPRDFVRSYDVVIGLGGSGATIGRSLYSRALNPDARLLLIDIVPNSSGPEDGVTAGTIARFALGPFDLPMAVRLVGPAISPPVNLERITGSLFRTSVSRGAFALFEVGLVASIFNVARLIPWLRSQFLAVPNAARERRIVVVVVGSIAGGTGTGLFPIISSVAHMALEDLEIYGCALDSSFFGGLPATDTVRRNEKHGIAYLRRGFPHAGILPAWDGFVLASTQPGQHDIACVVPSLLGLWSGQTAYESTGVTFQDLNHVASPDLLDMVETIDPERKPKVFISYAREDEGPALMLYDMLLARGFIPWIDKRDLLAGENWERSIHAAIRSADYVLVCMSKHSISKRGFVQKELRLALEYFEMLPLGTSFLIPLRLDDCEPPLEVACFQYVDLFAADGYEKLFYSLVTHWTNKRN